MIGKPLVHLLTDLLDLPILIFPGVEPFISGNLRLLLLESIELIDVLLGPFPPLGYVSEYY